MTFSVTHSRAFVGTNIAVVVTADSRETIHTVSVVLDAEELDTYQVLPGTESYTQEFAAVGQASPGSDHTLTATALDGDGQPHSSITRWTDTI
jgi:hypothetical protein